MDCIFEKNVEGQWECQRCHARYAYLSTRQCDADPEKPKPPKPEPLPSTTESIVPAIRGPGDYLHDAILRWVGESPTADCQCRSRIAQMNAWGPTGCREHLDKIVGWLLEEAAQRNWWKYILAIPGSRLFIRRMVMAAIKKAEHEHGHLN